MKRTERQQERADKLLGGLENDVLDEYNKGSISKKEMLNLMLWCEKVKKMKKDPNFIP